MKHLKNDNYDNVQRSPPAQETINNGGLTLREFNVLGLSELSNKQIAHKLSVEEGTVKMYACNILRKLNISNPRQAIMEALRRDLLSPTSP